ncbi:MAG: carboxypeptidase regulatory-like domain-containing protein [Chthoniobacteraceae bacterium]
MPFNNLANGLIEVTSGTLGLGSGGTWAGATFTVGANAAVNLEGGTKNWTGLYTGSGGGNVRFTAGTITFGQEGATLNFSPGLFEITNNPTINGAPFGNAGRILFTGDPNLGATLNNAGTININARLDFVSNGRLNNLDGGLLEIVGTGGDGNYFGNFGGPGIFNEGLFRKSGPAAASTSSVPVSNAGTVEVVSGSLSIPNLAQLTTGTLSGGTWRVFDSAVLNFPAGITTNAATIFLDGAAAALSQLAGLTTNAGSLSLLRGADLTTSGSLTNTGNLTLGPDSVLTVTGDFSQPGGRLELQIADTSASGQFGRVAIGGVATLGGTLAVNAVNAFAPGAGDSYTLLTFASRAGTFAAFEGIDQSFNPVFELVTDTNNVRINSLIAAPDISVSTITAPATGFVGKDVTITYTVENSSNRPSTVSDWTDAIYLSRDGVLDPSDFLFARVPHTGGIAALDTYTESVTRGIPGVLEGDYQIIVVADSRRVAPDLDRSNNVSTAGETIEVSIESLTLGGAVAGSIAEGQDVFFQIDLEAGMDVFFTGSFAVEAEVEFFVKFRDVPTRTTFDLKAASIFDLQQQIRVLNPRAGTYYVLLHGREGAGESEDYTLLADAAPFALDEVGQNFGANVGSVTVPLLGSGFQSTLEVELRPDLGGAPVLPSQIQVIDGFHAFATFNLRGVTPGAFDVVAIQEGAERFLDGGFDVGEGEAGRLEARIIVPERVRMTRPYTITVEFENRGGTDIPVSLLIVEASENNFVWANGQSQSEMTSTLQFLGANPDDLNGGVLRPGEKHSVILNAVTNGGSATFSLFSTSGNSTEGVDYPELKESLRPEVPPTLFDAAFDAVATRLGATYGEFIGNLAEVVDEARPFNAPVRTLSEIFGFLISREVHTLPSATVQGSLFIEDAAHPAGREVLFLHDTASDAVFESLAFFDGTFAFFDVPAGTYALEVDGFLSDSVTTITVPAAGPLTGVDVIAQPGETLTGRVIDPSGRSVANALIELTDALGRDFLATTDRNGVYRFAGLAPGSASIDLDVSHLVPLNDAVVKLVSGDSNTRDFSLASGGFLQGRVLEPGGTPAGGAELIARLVGGGDFSRTITAGFDGRFRLGGLPAGTYELVATDDGFGAGVLAQILVGNNATTPVDDISLTEGGRVSGTITDAATGQPIVGARFGPTVIGQQQAPFLSDAAGTFSAPNLTPGSFTALITAPGYISGFAQITLDSGENEILDVALRPLGQIDGVVQAAGSSIGGVELSLLPLAGGPQAEPFALVSGADGAFSFSGLPDGDYSLSIKAAGGTASRQVFTLDSSDNTHTTTLDLGAAIVSGQVRATDGTPLPSEVVSLYRGGEKIDAVYADEQGRYRFLVFQGGPIDLIASGPDLGVASTLQLDVPAGQAVVAPDLVAGTSSLVISVRAEADDGPVGGALVSIHSTTPGFEQAVFGGFTDATGQFDAPRLAPGEYAVEILKNGFAFETQIITVGAAASTLDFALDPGHVISGTVLDSDGQPIDFARVTFRDQATGEIFVSFTDDSGNYLRDTLPTGTFDVLITDGTLQPAIISNVELGSLPVRIDAGLVPSGVSLTGSVADASGDPAAQVLVELIGPGDVTLLSALTDANGVYELENLPAGAVQLRVSPSGFASVMASLTLPDTGQTTQNFTLGEVIAVGVDESAAVASSVRAPGSHFVFAQLPSGSQAVVDSQSFLIGSGLIDGGSGDFSTGLQPPARFDADTPEFRFGFPNPDEDCPDQVAAHNDAIRSALLINKAFDAYDSSFDALKGLNDADVAELVSLTKEILLDGVALADGVSGVKDLLGKDVRGNRDVVDNVRNTLSKAEDAVLDVVSDLRSGKLPPLSDLAKIGETLKGAIGLGADVNLNTGEVTVGGDIGRLSAIPIVGDIEKLYHKFQALNTKVTNFVDGDLLNRLGTYEGAQDRYLDAVLKHDANLAKLDAAIAAGKKGKGSPGPDPEDPDDDKKMEDKEDVPSVGSRDPNDIIGPVGFGPQNFVAADQSLDYSIRFENVATATAPAAVVTITHQLDSDVDSSTFQLGDFGFGGMSFEVPAGRDFFAQSIDMRDGLGVFVDVEAKINVQTGLVTWSFSAIDPETLDLTADPLAGFLPPNVTSPVGEGFVSYSIRAADTAPSGTVIDAQATIVFDQNEAIDTPAIFHTLDAEGPTSAVQPLPAVTNAPRIKLDVPGNDGAGSGLHSVDIYVADNGGPFSLYLNDFTGSSATFRGETGHTYSFSTVAKDNVGLTELLPLVADLTTLVQFEEIAIDSKNSLTFTDSDGDRVTIKLKGPGSGKVVLDDPDGDSKGGVDRIVLDGTTNKSKLTVQVKKSGGGDGVLTVGDVTVNGDLKLLNAKKADFVFNGVNSSGLIQSLAVNDLLQTEPAVFNAEISIGGSAGDKMKIKTGSLPDGFALETPAQIKSLSTTSIGDGSILAAALGKVTTKSGGLAADLEIATTIGKVTVKGGDISGLIRAGEKIASITAKAGKSGTGGNLADAVILAPEIGKITTKGDANNVFVLAGADLGDDFALGGIGANGDTFAPGTIKSLKINGTVTASVFAAGLDPVNGILHDADDTILGGADSAFGKINIKGAADPASYFAAGRFKKAQIAGDKIDPSTDLRFLVG